MAAELFGARPRSSREHAGMTLAQLATTVGTNQAQLSRWERNLGKPPLTTIASIADVLGVSLSLLRPDEP